MTRPGRCRWQRIRPITRLSRQSRDTRAHWEWEIIIWNQPAHVETRKLNAVNSCLAMTSTTSIRKLKAEEFMALCASWRPSKTRADKTTKQLDTGAPNSSAERKVWMPKKVKYNSSKATCQENQNRNTIKLQHRVHLVIAPKKNYNFWIQTLKKHFWLKFIHCSPKSLQGSRFLLLETSTPKPN